MSDQAQAQQAPLPAEYRAWSAGVLAKLGRIPRSDNKKLQAQRTKAGYAWHGADSPDRALVGVRAVFDSSGRVEALNIAGRPRAKHGGSQGQHTTAFGANREVVVSATAGRTEAEAREDLALLFRVLERYPAFTMDGQPAPPPQLVGMVKALGNPSSKLSQAYGLDELATLYLEIRDALPGASLDTGIEGKASTAGRENVIGKAEGRALNQLRALEVKAMAGTALNPDAAAEALMKLYDANAEDAVAYGDAVAQRRTFLLTAAQAFPAVFGQAGQQAAVICGQDPAWAAQLQDKVSSHLAKRNAGGTRPQPASIAARVGDTGISFTGRSESVKDAGTMGDHTCAEQLMKDAATRLLMPAGRLPTRQELSDGLTTIRDEFPVENYILFFDPEDLEDPNDQSSAQATDDDDDDAESSALFMHQVRYFRLQAHHEALDALLERVGDGESDEVLDKRIVAEAAELYMHLVDDRPSAVHYGAPAGGHGEAAALASLAEFERDGIGGQTPETLLDAALGLFDCRAAVLTGEELAGYGNEGAYIQLVAREFMFFVRNAYPATYAGIVAAGDAAVQQALEAKIREIGAAERGRGGEAYVPGSDTESRKPKRPRTK